jgi:hypothetical protein
MAVLQKQNVSVVFGGLDQKNPNTIGVPGQLATAQNLLIKKAETGSPTAFEFTRRNAVVGVANSWDSSHGFRMSSYGHSLVTQTLGGMQAYSQASASQQNVYRPLAPVKVGQRFDLQMPLVDASGSITPTLSSLDVAFYQDTACYVWVDATSTLAYFSIRDAKNGVIIGQLGAFSIEAGATNAKVVQLGGSFYMFWKAGGAIRGVSILATAPFTVGAPVTVVVAGSVLAGSDYDVQAGFDATHIALMFRTDATHHFRCLLSTAFAVTTSVSDSVAANQPDVAMAWIPQATYAGSLYYGTINSTSGAKTQTINATTLAITATVTDAAVKACANLTGAIGDDALPHLIYEVAGGSGHAYDRSTTMATVQTVPGVGLASRAFYLGGHPYVICLYNSDSSAIEPQNTYFIVSFQSAPGPYAGMANIQGVMAPGKSRLLQTHSVSSVAVDAEGIMHFLGGTQVGVNTSGTGTLVIQYGLSDFSIGFGSADTGAPINFGGVVLTPGGMLWEMDRDALFPAHEQGFNLYPEPPTLVEGAAASGSMPPGTRSYVVRWKWIDSNGQIYRSATSAPTSITTVNANSSVTITPATMPVTNRTVVHVEILCTPNNGTGDEYFKVTPAVYTGITTNAPISFTDTHSEATLNAGEPWTPPTANGEVENVAPPALNFVCVHAGRVFGISSEQPWRVFFSKKYELGTSIGFFDGFVLDAPESTPLYALASMDGHLLGFARDRIYVWDGDFPDATGAGAIPQPFLLPAQVGCDQPRSLVLTELGLAFYSSLKGFNLLDRSLNPTYIGAQVEQEAVGQVISGASIHPTINQVRFTSEGGTTFALDTYWTKTVGRPVWTTFTGQPCVASLVHDGAWYLLTAAGQLQKEDLTRWQDGTALGGGAFVAGAAFLAKLVVSDINFAGIAGLARVWRGQLLGEWYDSHKVSLTLGNDHRSVAGQAFAYDATSNPDPYQLEFRLRDQKATSVSVTIQDTADFQTQGFAWTALVFSVGLKTGLKRLPQGRNMTGGA